MFACSVTLSDPHKAKMTLLGVIISFAIVLVFQFLHFINPQALSLGILSGKTDSVLGSWNTLGLFSGFMTVVALFLIEFFSISKPVKYLLFFIIFLSLLLISAVNFSLIWGILGLYALVIFIYKVSFHSGFKLNLEGNVSFPTASMVIVMISLLFFMSSQFIGGFIPNHLKISNTEVTPSLGATLSVTKSVLMHKPILGVGPNKFGEVWAMYKPA
ncbi:hypothetical protein K2P96_02320, partial [Patescibacteria group bacterium]|nr:hypothetical protein [Patescibacteria group bacterium]